MIKAYSCVIGVWNVWGRAVSRAGDGSQVSMPTAACLSQLSRWGFLHIAHASAHLHALSNLNSAWTWWLFANMFCVLSESRLSAFLMLPLFLSDIWTSVCLCWSCSKVVWLRRTCLQSLETSSTKSTAYHWEIPAMERFGFSLMIYLCILCKSYISYVLLIVILFFNWTFSLCTITTQMSDFSPFMFKTVMSCIGR